MTDQTTDELFLQDPPRLTNTFRADASLRRHLARVFNKAELDEITPGLDKLGEDASGKLAELMALAEKHQPELESYGPYGHRIDKVHEAIGWREIHDFAIEAGIMAVPYEAKHGWKSRVHQMAQIHLFGPSSAFVGCPYAMTDGCIATLKEFGDPSYADEPIRRLMSRDPADAWTSGQWMTEKEGGSDLKRTSTFAKKEGDVWRLYGNKFYTSAITADCAMTLAKVDGVDGLSLFYVRDAWNADGTPQNFEIRKLKPKLGTQALPTAEIDLEGTIAFPVGELGHGVRKITKVLNLARFHNTIAATGTMARCVQLARDYADRREAFGQKLVDLPLHAETLAEIQVHYEAGLAVAVRLAELLGKVENGVATESEEATWRLLTPLAKLGTGKQAVKVASETVEAIGGVGYMEDSDISRLLRDAQVLSIWEGTTNVLSLDGLRAMAKTGALPPFLKDAHSRVRGIQDAELAPVVEAVKTAVHELGAYAETMLSAGRDNMEAAARGFALSLFRTYAAALLAEAAAWEISEKGSRRGAVAANRWVRRGLLDLNDITDEHRADSRLLIG